MDVKMDVKTEVKMVKTDAEMDLGTDIKKAQQIYAGKAKTLYATNHPDYLVLEFRDDTSAFNGVKVAKLENKGKVNNQFNAFIMEILTQAGIPSHFEKCLSETESLVKHLEMLPIECVIRNKVAGGLAKRLGLAEGTALAKPIFEFYFKNDALNDPMINEYHVLAFNWATEKELYEMKQLTFKVNEILQTLFTKVNLELIDFKLEFGRFKGKLCLGDEITPDGCRIWDATTQEKLDKDRFRRDLGNVIESYEIVQQRLLGAINA